MNYENWKQISGSVLDSLSYLVPYLALMKEVGVNMESG